MLANTLEKQFVQTGKAGTFSPEPCRGPGMFETPGTGDLLPVQGEPAAVTKHSSGGRSDLMAGGQN